VLQDYFGNALDPGWSLPDRYILDLGRQNGGSRDLGNKAG